jgi:hypothetical protein
VVFSLEWIIKLKLRSQRGLKGKSNKTLFNNNLLKIGRSWSFTYNVLSWAEKRKKKNIKRKLKWIIKNLCGTHNNNIIHIIILTFTTLARVSFYCLNSVSGIFIHFCVFFSTFHSYSMRFFTIFNLLKEKSYETYKKSLCMFQFMMIIFIMKLVSYNKNPTKALNWSYFLWMGGDEEIAMKWRFWFVSIFPAGI